MTDDLKVDPIVDDAIVEGKKPAAAADSKAPGKDVIDKSLADAGDDDAGADDKVSQTWPDNWREQLAGKDKSALKQLGRYQSPEGVWSKIKNLEKRLAERDGGPKKPDDGATPEEVAEYRKAVGLAESPEKLIEAVKLPDGRTIGDDDKPLVESFAKAMWEDANPAQMSKALAWYYDRMEAVAAKRFEDDENFKAEQRRVLKEEWGAGEFKANINALKPFFDEGPEGIFDKIMSARYGDGRRLGDDAEVLKFLVAKAHAENPMAAIVSGGTTRGTDRLSEIRAMRNSVDHAQVQKYYSPEIQAEELALIAAQLKQKARHTSRAA